MAKSSGNPLHDSDLVQVVGYGLVTRRQARQRASMIGIQLGVTPLNAELWEDGLKFSLAASAPAMDTEEITEIPLKHA